MRDSMSSAEFAAVLQADEKIAGGKSNGQFLILNAKRFAAMEAKLLPADPPPRAAVSSSSAYAGPQRLKGPPPIRLPAAGGWPRAEPSAPINRPPPRMSRIRFMAAALAHPVIRFLLLAAFLAGAVCAALGIAAAWPLAPP